MASGSLPLREVFNVLEYDFGYSWSFVTERVIAVQAPQPLAWSVISTTAARVPEDVLQRAVVE